MNNMASDSSTTPHPGEAHLRNVVIGSATMIATYAIGALFGVAIG